MAKESLAYKTVQKMLEELESGKQFTKRLRGRCFKEASFDELEFFLSKSDAEILEYESKKSGSGRVVSLPFVRKYPMAIAASISLLLVALYFSVRLFIPNEVITQLAQYKTVELPDHSKITLNADSKVEYNPVSWYWDRRVSLEGEAYFEVEKGSDFIVSTKSGKVRVLGTSFNVKDRANQFRVDCKTGKVEVAVDDQKIILVKNESAELNVLNNNLAKIINKNNYVATWKKGYFSFDSESLASVIEELERQYNIEIDLRAEKDYLFTGYFPISNIDSSLETVCSALGLSYSFQDKQNKKTAIIIQ
ncbi:MAG: FecR domain-containing protein [Cytophagales bacterium]